MPKSADPEEEVETFFLGPELMWQTLQSLMTLRCPDIRSVPQPWSTPRRR
jgi:hypothetical protein